MTDTVTEKPTIKAQWTAPPAVETPLGDLDWGVYRPLHLPVQFDAMPEHEPDHGEIMDAMSRVLTIARDPVQFGALLSPDLGLRQRSYHRPDLASAVYLALELLQGIQKELLEGPKRTRLNRETGEWEIVIPHGRVEAEARRNGRLPKGI